MSNHGREADHRRGGGLVSSDREQLRWAYALAAEQGGVLRREQLLAQGVSPKRLTRWLDSGSWQAHYRSVLVAPGVRDDLKTRSLVVAQRLGRDACVTGPSAIAVMNVETRSPWDALKPSDVPWVIYPGHARVRAKVIRRASVGSRMAQGVAIADSRTVMLDLLRYLPREEARQLAYRASGHGEWSTFMGKLPEHADRLAHARGVRQLRWLADLLSTGAQAESEREMHNLLNRAGLTGWKANAEVRVGGHTYRVDVAFEEAKLGLEIDGRAFHDDRRFQGDRTRHNALEAAGWQILHFTWEHVTEQPFLVVAQVRSALASRRVA